MASCERTQSENLTLQAQGYYLSKILGEGSYGKVYLAEYRFKTDANEAEKPGYKVACKIIDVSEAPREFTKKFLPRELAVLNKINHPHLINVYSIFQRKSKYYVFMRFAENGDLLEFILKNGAVSEKQSKVWMRQLCLAVQYLHHMEVAHRDLKCENALITANYNLKISDFGFARYVIDAHNKPLISDTYCGSLSYAAPEILSGRPYQPKISDVWSLGIILYIMLNKAMPFDDGDGGPANIRRLREQQIRCHWKFRSKYVTLLSKEVQQLTRSLLEPDITKRPTIDQVLQFKWFKSDSKLSQLSKAEQTALRNAHDERKKYIEQLKDRDTKDLFTGSLSTGDLNIIKDDRKAITTLLYTESLPSVIK